MKKCNTCGADMQDNEIYCSNCGAPVETTTVTPDPVEIPAEEPVTANAVPPVQPTPQQEPVNPYVAPTQNPVPPIQNPVPPVQNAVPPVQNAVPPVQPIYQQPNSVPYGTEQPKNNGKCIASLVLGIASITICCGGLLPAILGIIFSILGKKDVTNNPTAYKPASKGMATAGLVCSILGCVAFVIVMIVCLVSSETASYVDNYYDYY